MMREESKFYNSFLSKVIKFTEKTIAEIDSKQAQLSLYTKSEKDQEALHYSSTKLKQVLAQLSKARDV